MFPKVIVEARGAAEALDYLRAVHAQAGPMLRRLGFGLLFKIKVAALRNLSGVYPGPNLEHVLAVRTGTARRFVSAQNALVLRDGLAWGLPAEQTESRILAKQEVGGEIRPKRAKMLRIPLRLALTPQGVDRYAGQQLPRLQSSLKSGTVSGFTTLGRKSRSGWPILYRVSGTKTRTKIEPWYVLVPKVTLRPVGWFADAVESQGAEVSKMAEAELATMLRVSR